MPGRIGVVVMACSSDSCQACGYFQRVLDALHGSRTYSTVAPGQALFIHRTDLHKQYFRAERQTSLRRLDNGFKWIDALRFPARDGCNQDHRRMLIDEIW
ncbi:MAG: hypothetical protein AUK03_17265 [Anaerolineae bacterium CG2_30_64_16]|nr:MAG: hypothetical protein AUK03_17265 [Anaerolineae bacterium CG2_30_64_16]